MSKLLFYQPNIGVIGDIIPYYENGKFYLYYLHDYRDNLEYGEGTPWDLITTQDFVNFHEYGEVISRGHIYDQDLFIFTGSVIKEDKDNYHIFYTGHNPHLREQGKPIQAIMHAISHDLVHWQKVPEDTFYAPKDSYEEDDWRDPFVYFDEQENKYVMLLAARTKEGLSIRKGCTAICESKDLKKWAIKEPLWSPRQFFTHECPDLFKIGEWWYLIYSEFTDQCMTRYIMSKDLETWNAPQLDVFDGRAFYAAKTASDGSHRYLFGWVPTKKNNDDHRDWQWGGNLVVHELYQKTNDELGVRIPQSINSSFLKDITIQKEYHISSPQGYNHQLIELPKLKRGIINCSFETDVSATSFGILVNYDEAKDYGYAYTFNQRTHQFGFGIQPNTPWNYSNFHNVWTTYEDKKKHVLTLLFEEDILVAYLDGEKALTTRVYNSKGNFGFFAIDGEVTFTIERIATK